MNWVFEGRMKEESKEKRESEEREEEGEGEVEDEEKEGRKEVQRSVSIWPRKQERREQTGKRLLINYSN